MAAYGEHKCDLTSGEMGRIPNPACCSEPRQRQGTESLCSRHNYKRPQAASLTVNVTKRETYSQFREIGAIIH